MRLRKIISTFEFTNQSLSTVSLGTGVRVDVERNKLELASSGGKYPLDPDLYAKTRVLRPTTMKQVVGFEANVTHAKVNLVVVTSVGFRLSDDGINELFWDGSGWVAASPGDWNTEEEVADNIQHFPMANRGVQIILNLATTNAKYTPSVLWVKLLWESDIEWMEDYIERSFIAALRSVEPIAEYKAKVAAPSSEVVLKLQTPYNVTGIDSAFNVTNDPDKLVDLYSAWAPQTKTVTLSVEADTDDYVFIRFKYKPVIAMTTDQEYGQLAKVPAIEIDGVSMANEMDMIGADSVANKRTGDAWQISHGTQADLVISMRMIADKEKDAQRMYDAVHGYFAQVGELVAKGIDEQFSVLVERPYLHASSPGQTGLYAARITVRILRAVFYRVEATTAKTATKPMTFGGGGNVII